jgi:hypothetical protein
VLGSELREADNQEAHRLRGSVHEGGRHEKVAFFRVWGGVMADLDQDYVRGHNNAVHGFINRLREAVLDPAGEGDGTAQVYFRLGKVVEEERHFTDSLKRKLEAQQADG